MKSILLLMLVVVVVFFLMKKVVGNIGKSPPASATGSRSDRLQTDGTMTMDYAYKILGLPPNADPLKVKQVYRDLAEAWHVDRSGITDDERMKELNAAYDCLKQAGKAR